MAGAARAQGSKSRLLVIAHRGASDYLPEHTLEGYAAGYLMGAEFVEPDVVATRDGVLICNHDVELDLTTNVREVYPDRARGDGHWCATDFTLEEIRRLRRTPRDQGGSKAAPAWPSLIPTLEEMIALVQRLNERAGRRVGVIPEIKKPTFHRETGIDIEDLIVRALVNRGYATRSDAAVIQCFEWGSLERIRGELGCDLRLLALTDAEDSGKIDLDEAAHIADWLGPSRRVIEADDGSPTGGRTFVDAAHERGLAVVPWTFKNEPEALSRFFQEYGVDALFADDPAAARRAVDHERER